MYYCYYYGVAFQSVETHYILAIDTNRVLIISKTHDA